MFKLPKKLENAVVRFVLTAGIVGVTAAISWAVSNVQTLPFNPQTVAVIAGILSVVQKAWKDATGKP